MASTTLLTTKDAYVNYNAPDTNYGNSIVLMVSCSPDYTKRVFIGFDLSSIPAGATITYARLGLYIRYTVTTSRTYLFDRVTGSWTENGVTWNNQPAVTTTHQASKTITFRTYGWWYTDVTLQVQDAWALGTDYSVRVKDSAETCDPEEQGTFASREWTATQYDPRLYIEYTVPAAAKLLRKQVGVGL